MTNSSSAATAQNTWRGPFNAWFFTAFDRYIDYVTEPSKRAALAELGSSAIVEIGSGVGANLHYLAPGSKLIAFEPNRAMHDGLRRRADKAGVELEILATPGSAIPLPDQAVDEVICTLVLCTVDDPAATLTEVSHPHPRWALPIRSAVVAPAPSPRRLVQRLLNRPWSWVFEGCQLDWDTATLLDRAGFTAVSMARRKPRRSVFWIVNTQIHGIAVR